MRRVAPVYSYIDNSPGLLAAIISKVKRKRPAITVDSGCIEYPGPNCCGYPRIQVPGTRTTIGIGHVNWRVKHGRWVTPGLLMLHLCDNKRCCNADHLYEGTGMDNYLDMRLNRPPAERLAKRGAVRIPGEPHPDLYGGR